MFMKHFWRNLPIAHKIFIAILIFLTAIEIIATVYVWKVETKILLKKEKQNLQRELRSYKDRLVTHLDMLQKEIDFLAKLEIMDDIVAKDIDQRILTLMERKSDDLGENILMLFTDNNSTISIAKKAYIGLPVKAFKSHYLFFHSRVFASFDKKKKLGTLWLLYPYKNLQHLKTNNRYKSLWLQTPSNVFLFPTRKMGDDVLVVSQKIENFLPNWSLNLSYLKSEALISLKNIETIQLYTFFITTFLMAIIIFILSKKLTLPLLEVLKNSEKELEAKSTFLSTISHELRTPLGSILNLTQHLTISKNIDDKSRKMLHAIETSAQHLLAMINNILQLSKLEANSVIAQKEQINIEEILEEILEITIPLMDDKSIDFKKQILITKNYLISDSNLLKQVLINILSNAIKYTNGGKIILTLSNKDDKFIFSVKDSGIGISKDKQKQLFKPFFQVNNRQHTQNSSGLGLALSQKVAKLLGGKIVIQSDGTNKGTLAIFYFKSI